MAEICIQQMKKMCPDFEIYVLNWNNIEQYLGALPKFHPSLAIANISDYIRLALLKKYGGFWLDTTIFLTESLDWILEKIQHHDAFVFYTDDCTINLNKPITENWLIVAPENSRFIKAWFEEYKRCIFSENPENYYDEVYKYQELMQNLPKMPYFNCYISAIIVLHLYKFNLVYARSGSVGHYYNYRFINCYENIAITLLLLNKNEIVIPKLIKFTKDSRQYMDIYLNQRHYQKNSLIGEIAEQYFQSINE